MAKRLVLAALALFLFGRCDDSPQGSRSVRLGEPFTLSVGESVSVEDAGLDVTFVGVVADSRCPIDIVCLQIVPGSARIRVAVEVVPLPRAVLELDSASGAGATGSYAGFDVAFEAIAPPRRSDREIPARAYRATLEVTPE